jgi:hypothetical protein
MLGAVPVSFANAPLTQSRATCKVRVAEERCLDTKAEREMRGLTTTSKTRKRRTARRADRYNPASGAAEMLGFALEGG